MTYQGYPSYATWNINLWINNTQGLYWACYVVAQMYKAGYFTKDKAVEVLVETFIRNMGERTKDGARVSKRACRIWLDHHLTD